MMFFKGPIPPRVTVGPNGNADPALHVTSPAGYVTTHPIANPDERFPNVDVVMPKEAPTLKIGFNPLMLADLLKTIAKLMDMDTKCPTPVAFEFTDVDLLTGAEREAIIAEVRKLNPECSFPTIIIGDQVIVGNNEEKIRKALGL